MRLLYGRTDFQTIFFSFIGKAGDTVSVGVLYRRMLVVVSSPVFECIDKSVFFIVEMLVVVSSDMGLFGGIWGRKGCIRQVEGSRIYFLLASLQLFKETE